MKAPFILLHGAWHGGWCWKHVKSLLEAAGHPVLAPDLPAHGTDSTPVSQVNLSMYVNFVGKLIEQQAMSVCLVGHSMAGIILSELAEKYASRIRQLVYVAAFIPSAEDSLMDAAKQSSQTELTRLTQIDTQEKIVYLDVSSRERVQDIFYQDCEEADVDMAMGHLNILEPFQPFIDRVCTTDAQFGQVPKVYVTCEADRVIDRADQKRMAMQSGCREISVPSSHSPFFSMPGVLAEVLLS